MVENSSYGRARIVFVGFSFRVNVRDYTEPKSKTYIAFGVGSLRRLMTLHYNNGILQRDVVCIKVLIRICFR